MQVNERDVEKFFRGEFLRIIEKLDSSMAFCCRLSNITLRKNVIDLLRDMMRR